MLSLWSKKYLTTEIYERTLHQLIQRNQETSINHCRIANISKLLQSMQNCEHFKVAPIISRQLQSFNPVKALFLSKIQFQLFTRASIISKEPTNQSTIDHFKSSRASMTINRPINQSLEINFPGPAHRALGPYKLRLVTNIDDLIPWNLVLSQTANKSMLVQETMRSHGRVSMVNKIWKLRTTSFSF